MFWSKIFRPATKRICDRKGGRQIHFWQDSSGCIFGRWWDSLKLFYKCCTSFDKTEQQLAQQICDTLQYPVIMIVVFIICGSFVKLHLSSSSTVSDVTSVPHRHYDWMRCLDRWKKKIYLDLMHKKIAFAQCDIRYFVWKRSCPISSLYLKSAVRREKKKHPVCKCLKKGAKNTFLQIYYQPHLLNAKFLNSNVVSTLS